jgi:hypothetical protein
VTDPMDINKIGQVCLRPVKLGGLEELVVDTTLKGRCQRENYAAWLAFGEE